MKKSRNKRHDRRRSKLSPAKAKRRSQRKIAQTKRQIEYYEKLVKGRL